MNFEILQIREGRSEKWTWGGERGWEGKYWSRLSELSATFKLLWTTAGTLPASDGFNSLLHCSPQPPSLLFSLFLTSKMDFLCVRVCMCVCVCCIATGSGLMSSAYAGAFLWSFTDTQWYGKWQMSYLPLLHRNTCLVFLACLHVCLKSSGNCIIRLNKLICLKNRI